MPVQLLPFQKVVDMPNLAQRYRRAICGLAIASITLIFIILWMLVWAFIGGFALRLYSTSMIFTSVGIPSMAIVLILVFASSFISLRNTDKWASTDACCNLMRSYPTCCTKCCAGNKHCCARMSCLHAAASIWTSLFCVLLMVLLFTGCNESDSITRAYESKFPSGHPGRSLRSLGCLEQSEENIKVGSRVTLIANREAFRNSFNNVPYIWDDAMTSLLGQTVTVVDRPSAGIFGLPKSDPRSSQSVWWYPFSAIACVKGNATAPTTNNRTVWKDHNKYSSYYTSYYDYHKTTPSSYVDQRDKCLDIVFAIQHYQACCTNFAYRKKGHGPVCLTASPCAKAGMHDPRCKLATKPEATAPTTKDRSMGKNHNLRDQMPTTKRYYRFSGYSKTTSEQPDYFYEYEKLMYARSKSACGVLVGFEIPALVLMICVVITTALSAWLLRKIEQGQPEIELLPAGKMVVQACEDAVVVIPANAIGDAQVTNDVNLIPELKTEQN